MFLASQPMELSRICFDRPPIGSVCRALLSAVWVFSLSGFHCLFATKPGSSETSKAQRRGLLRLWDGWLCQRRMKTPHFAGRKFPTPEVEPSAVFWRVLGATEADAKM
jgi:hypothetical protein